MSENKFQRAELADLLGVIERLAGELSLAEEPARFTAALEEGAPDAGGIGTPGSSGSPG